MLWIALATVTVLATWLSVCLMLSGLSRWNELAASYGAGARRFAARKLGGGRVGRISYGGCLWLGCDAGGFGLSVLALCRPGHKPLYLPWAAMSISTKKQLGRSMLQLRMRGVGDAAVELPLALGEWLYSQSSFEGLRTAIDAATDG